MENKSEIIEMFIRSHMAWKLTPPQLTPYPVLVWAGESASEQTGLRRLMSVLPLTADVSILNTTQLLSSEKFQYTCTGEISSEKLRQILGLEISMSAEAKTALAEDWERLTAEKGLLRIWKDGRLSSVPESYFDFRIMEAAAELGAFRGEFRKSARIIGQVIGYSEQRLSDEFIQARVKQLIEEGVFTYQGDLSSMRYYSISLTEAGLAELQLEQKNPD